MDHKNHIQIYSGASPKQVAEDLKPLVEFRDEGMPLDAITELINERLIPHLMQYDQPGFQSMFNAFPEEGAEFGARVALAYNQGVTNWQVSPGGAMLEELCCKALCRLFDLPPDADATFMYSGTYANQEALYLALHRKAEEHGFNLALKGLNGFEDLSRLVVLTSQDAHFSIKHAVRMLGLGEESIIPLEVDNNRRIDVAQMQKLLEELNSEKEIVCVIASSGTTSTGAVDPIRPIAKLCNKSGIWLHVDGAYGLAYSLVPEWKTLFAGRELADSVSWDPHKQLGIPIPNSLLFVRQGKDFNRMALYSGYFNPEEAPEPNPGLKSPPSTRPFSALPLVTSILYQGMNKVIERLRAPLKAIKQLHDYLERDAEIECCHRPDTGIQCFRVRPQGFPEKQLNQLQHYIYDKIMAEGARSISVSKFGEKTALRLLAISPAVKFAALKETISKVRQLAGEYSHKKVSSNAER